MASRNPYYDLAEGPLDILVCHSPVKGHVDGGNGCMELERLVQRTNPRLVVSGHIHKAHGVEKGESDGVIYANAANAQRGHGHMGWPAIFMEL